MKLQMKYWGLLAALLTMLPVPAAEAGRMTVVTHGTHPVPAAGIGSSAVAFDGRVIRLGGFAAQPEAGKLVSAPGSETILEISRNAQERRPLKSTVRIRPLAAFAGTGSAIVMAGGLEPDGALSRKAQLLHPQGDILKSEPLPELPVGIAAAGIAEFEGRYYLAGGVTSLKPLRVNRKIYVYDPALPQARWEADAGAPESGQGRILPFLSSQNGLLTLFGGWTANPDGTLTASSSIWRLKTGGWKDAGWRECAPAPAPLGGSCGFRLGVTHYGFAGLRSTPSADSFAALFAPAPVRDTMLVYSNVTDRFFEVPLPPEAAMAECAAEFARVLTGAGGRNISEPGVLFFGTGQAGEPLVRFSGYRVEKSSLNWVDYSLIGAYLALLVWIGLHFARKGKDSSDYFVGGHKMPMWVAAISAQAAGASGITMMALPAMAYQSNLLYWGMLFWGIIPAVLSAVFIIPLVRKLNIVSCYEYLDARFARGIRQFASTLFVISLVFIRLGVVTLLPAMAIAAVTGLNVYICIILTGAIATLYTVIGGINSVAWCDVFQFIIMTGGAILCMVLMVCGTDGGISGFIDVAAKYDKWTMYDFSWDWTMPTVWLCLLTTPLTMFNGMSDQGFIQRVMAVKDVREAKQVTVWNFLLALPVQSAMWIIGVGLFVFFYQNPGLFDPTLAPDSAFPQFIVESLPAGIRGLLIIGIVAASMSTIDAGMNSVGAVLVTDFLKVWKPECSEKALLFFSRFFTFLAGALCTLAAVVFATFDAGSLWVSFSKVTALLIGGFPSIFMLGMLTKRGNTAGVIAGWIVSMAVVYFVQEYTDISFVYYPALALIAAFAVGYLVSVLTGGSRKDLTGLTVFTPTEQGGTEA